MTEGGSLAFVDLAVDDENALFRVDDWLIDVLPSLVGFETVLFRWPTITVQESVDYRLHENPTALLEWDAMLAADVWLRRVRHRRLRALADARIGVLVHTIGSEASIRFAEEPLDDRVDDATKSSLVRRCRAAEVNALLARGRALWQPPGYHFRLPSGQHSGSFVRVADTIRSPRDAFALSSWIVPFLGEDDGMLIDTGSLTPIVVQTHAILQSRGLRPGPIAVLDDYPRTRLGAKQAARHAVGRSGGLVSLISVSASGRLCDLLGEAIDAIAARRSAIAVVVDKGKNLGEIDDVDVWFSLEDEANTEQGQTCKLCLSSERSRVVQIDPRSFEMFPLPEPERLLPSLADLHRNREFWDLCVTADAVAMITKVFKDGGPRPRYGRLGFRLLYDRLFGDLNTVRAALGARLSYVPDTDYERENYAHLSSLVECQLVVLDRGGQPPPSGGHSWTDVAREVTDQLGIPSSVPIHEELEEVGSARTDGDVLVISVAAVTGWTLMERCEEVRTALGDRVRISVLILHSRPASHTEWALTKSAFAGRCGYLWQTYLPWDSPFTQEVQLLEEFLAEAGPDVISDDARTFVETRFEVVNPPDSLADWNDRIKAFVRGESAIDPREVYWRPFKERSKSRAFDVELSGPTGFLAVGCALAASEARLALEHGSLWRVVDFTEIARMRFEPEIVLALLRWVNSSQAWWGRDPLEARIAMAMLLDAADRDVRCGLNLMVAECVLASAMGKVDPAAIDVVTGVAAGIVDDPRIEAASAILHWARPMTR
jgi:hypothetical protein